MTHTQCHFNNFLCLISFSLTSSLTEQHSKCGYGPPVVCRALPGGLRSSMFWELHYTQQISGKRTKWSKRWFLSCCVNGVQRGKKGCMAIGGETSLFFWGKLLTVEFWTLFYILSVYSSQKVLDLCKWRQNRAADDAEQHDQIAAENPESQESFMHLTFQGDFEQLSLITYAQFNLACISQVLLGPNILWGEPPWVSSPPVLFVWQVAGRRWWSRWYCHFQGHVVCLSQRDCMLACVREGHTVLGLSRHKCWPYEMQGTLGTLLVTFMDLWGDLNLGCTCGSILHMAVLFWGELQRKGCHLLKCHSWFLHHPTSAWRPSPALADLD